MIRKFLAITMAGIMLAGGVVDAPRSWFFTRASVQEASPGWEGDFDLAEYNAFYLGDTSRKEIFLTFDEGYENGHTAQILDVLRDKNAPAAFFVTKPYMKDEPELIRRMIDEGHLVVNHTVKHKSSPTLTAQELAAELDGVEDYFKEVFGAEMAKFWRPPMGQYNLNTLQTAKEQGYATIFWSFAYQDWLIDKQPSVADAHKKVVDGLHNGAILLLHAVSSANAAAMADIIDSARALGYEFVSLHRLTGEVFPPTIRGGN
ncbi:MAG: polysaccharide deacetylase family protein [Defluviitaleaceae bacterium]|nr:polysaccharide deacetylase family protein [Defluviitaleaceae bacterium]